MRVIIEFDISKAKGVGQPTYKEILENVKDVLSNAFNQSLEGDFEIVDSNGDLAFYEFTEPELNLYSRDQIAGKWDWKANA